MTTGTLQFIQQAQVITKPHDEQLQDKRQCSAVGDVPEPSLAIWISLWWSAALAAISIAIPGQAKKQGSLTVATSLPEHAYAAQPQVHFMF